MSWRTPVLSASISETELELTTEAFKRFCTVHMLRIEFSAKTYSFGKDFNLAQPSQADLYCVSRIRFADNHKLQVPFAESKDYRLY